MQLMEIMQAFDARVIGGSEYQWQCYGNYARYMDFVDRDGLECASAVHDTVTFRVYELNLYIPGQDQAFRWIDPEYKQQHMDECVARGVSINTAWDNVKYTEVDESTALRYARDIAGTYYDDLPVPEMS